MEGIAKLTGSLAEFLGRHPEVVDVTPVPVEGTLRATVAMDGGYGYVHAADEAELLVKLAADLGG